MPGIGLSRRSLLAGAGGAALAGAALAGTGLDGTARAADARLRLYWWGSQERARRTNAVADLYQKQTPGITIVGESAGNDYWQKLVTEIAGRNAPDIFQLEPNSYADFARRGAVEPLDGLIPKPLDIESFGRPMLDLCAADGKIWAVGLGLNSLASFYDTEALAQAGVPPPTPQTTWQEHAERSVAITKALGRPGFWGSADGARYNYVFQVWLRQRGRDLFTADQKLGFTVDDAREWFEYWADIRRRGGCVAPDIQATDAHNIETNALALGKCAVNFAYSNELIGYQLQVKPKLGITMYPSAGPGGRWGQFYRAALMWAIARTSRQKEQAAAFINYFVTNPEAGKILGVERGVPLSPTVRKLILPGLDQVAQATVEYINFIADKLGPIPPTVPRGANDFDRSVMRPTADLVAFGRLTPAEGAAKLVADGSAVIG